MTSPSRTHSDGNIHGRRNSTSQQAARRSQRGPLFVDFSPSGWVALCRLRGLRRPYAQLQPPARADLRTPITASALKFQASALKFPHSSLRFPLFALRLRPTFVLPDGTRANLRRLRSHTAHAQHFVSTQRVEVGFRQPEHCERLTQSGKYCDRVARLLLGSRRCRMIFNNRSDLTTTNAFRRRIDG